jgi:hypothetical protein
LSRNKDRLGGHKPEPAEATPQFNPLNFVAPTEFVDLPSGGLGYPEGHALFGQDTIEIKYMTAKDEDILTSQTLLKKGVAIDRFLENIILDKSITANSLLIGDKNAILVAARSSGYGSQYEGTISCPQCSTKNRLVFDLANPTMIRPDLDHKLGVTLNDNGTYAIKLPFSGFSAQLRLMTGEDENYLAKYVEKIQKTNEPENLMTTQFKRMIVSIEGHSDKNVIEQFVDNMPTADSRHIRLVNRLITPNIEIKQNLKCINCGHTEEVDVPFGADFFWPNR